MIHWQYAIPFILFANILGNFWEALRARRAQKRERLHWLIPKIIGWAGLSASLLMAHGSGAVLSHWHLVAGTSIVLLLYAITLEITDHSVPPLPLVSVEIPHFGTAGPEYLVVVPLVGLFMISVEIFQQRHVSSNNEILLIGCLLGLVFGVRLWLCRFSLRRVSDLAALTICSKATTKGSSLDDE